MHACLPLHSRHATGQHIPPRGVHADELAEPFGRVLFAGEATSNKAPASVHGALLSGQREAWRLLNATAAQAYAASNGSAVVGRRRI